MGSETVKRLQDFARIRREDVNSRGRVFDLSKTVESAIEMSKPWWKTSPEKEGYSIRLIKRLTPEALIEGQENEIFEVVTNLIKNASEALPSGGNIRVAVTRLDSQVRLLVEDNGIGIAEEHKNHIFQPFWTTKGYAGTGMGLSTCYGIVKRHQGEINVESNIGQGATFIISFPAAQPERSTEAPPQRSEPDVKYNILVIDDMPAVLKQLDKGLSRVGQTVFTAKSGARGLDIINETHVDAVVCDLGMPDMNGLQVARRIKALYEERGTKRPLFVILTGWGGQIDRSEANRDNGVDLVLEKPIPSNQLLQRIIEMAGA
jgi:CheY-like chemotaxis protein